MQRKVAIILIISILSAGCLSEKPFKGKDVVFDLKPEEITVKNNETGEVKIRVANDGKSVIYPVASFNTNSSDKPYIDFNPASYDLGRLRPGEDSGFRIVEVKARLAAGSEIKYRVRVEVVNNGSVLESRDILITVKG